MFTTVTGEALKDRITTAKTRVVFVAPGVTEDVSKALVEAHHRSVFVTVILDLDQDACRIGFGDPEGLAYLREHGSTVGLYQQAGMRIGLLLADEVLTIWSPTPRSVENDRREGQPNAIVLDGRIVGDSLGNDVIESLKNEAIGRAPIRPDELQTVVAKLERDPPTPFDLARKVRVFSTRFQFVEANLRGAEYTPRRIRISNLLLNADLPKNLQDVLETQIRPFKAMEGVAIDAPHIIRGQIAYDQHGEKILVPMTEADVGKFWDEIKKRYLFEIPGFGSLIRKADLVSFRAEVHAFEELLRDWVKGFREQIRKEEDLVPGIVTSIKERVSRSDHSGDFQHIDLSQEVKNGLDGMRVIEPRTKIVLKEVSWESSRDSEFTDALQQALTPEDLQGWFDEFTAARENR